MDYAQYQNGRNAAWRILLDQNVTELPVRISAICRELGIDVRRFVPKAGESDGHTLLINGRPVILVSSACSTQRARFTAAHEFGHIVLGHIGKAGLVNREPSPDDDPLEQQANVFASRILAPAIVLRDLGVRSAEDIAKICDISKAASEFRWQRLQLLYDREQQFLAERGYSCFGLHPLERELRCRFDGYIKDYHRCSAPRTR